MLKQETIYKGKNFQVRLEYLTWKGYKLFCTYTVIYKRHFWQKEIIVYTCNSPFVEKG